VHARGVEAGQPHVAHDDQLEWIFGVAGALGEQVASRLVADVLLPFGWSLAAPVITILMAPALSSVLCQSGRNLTISLYSATQMRRLMHTTIALPFSAASLS